MKCCICSAPAETTICGKPCCDDCGNEFCGVCHRHPVELVGDAGVCQRCAEAAYDNACPDMPVICRAVRRGTMLMILMQGPPGRGKSTVARTIARLTGARICSTDSFHCDYDGRWLWQPDNLGYFHAWNVWLAEHYLSQGQSVLIDNCNITNAHARPYVALAFRCRGEYESIHGVPPEVVQAMRDKIETLDVD